MSAFYLRIAIAFCVIVGLYDVVYVVALNLSDHRLAYALRPVVGDGGPTIYPDFITPYGAVRAYFEGKLSIVYDHPKFTAFLNELYKHRTNFTFQPFLYPPVWLLALLPLGLLPVYVACVAFMVVTAAIFAFEIRRDLWGWLIGVTSPAAVWVVLSGQNTFLYVALIYGGLRIVEKSPATGGMLLGLLVYKPQVCLLVPLALFASRQWKALSWMIGTGTVVVLASAFVLGPQIWLDYIAMSREMNDPSMIDLWASRLSTLQISPFVAIRILGLADATAGAVQLVAAVVAAGAVWFAFRHYPASVARTAILMAATLLASPYAINYDLLLLMPTVVLLYRQGVSRGFFPLEPLVYLILWLLPTAILWLNPRLPVTPVFVFLFGLVAVLRLLRTSPTPTRGL